MDGSLSLDELERQVSAEALEAQVEAAAAAVDAAARGVGYYRVLLDNITVRDEAVNDSGIGSGVGREKLNRGDIVYIDRYENNDDLIFGHISFLSRGGIPENLETYNKYIKTITEGIEKKAAKIMGEGKVSGAVGYLTDMVDSFKPKNVLEQLSDRSLIARLEAERNLLIQNRRAWERLGAPQYASGKRKRKYKHRKTQKRKKSSKQSRKKSKRRKTQKRRNKTKRR